MKHEIIYTEHYSLIVSDEQIKDVRPHKGKFHLEKGYIINQFPTYLTDLTECRLIIAHRPLTDAPILEGVPFLPEFSQEEDAEDLALAYSSSKECVNPEGYSDKQVGLLHGFIDGYNKAKETYVEILKTIESLCDNQNPTHEEIWRLCYSVTQPKRPEYFETVCDCQECGANKTNLSLDMGCENKMAKTTNSQGQTELVGEYSYE
jgi:hypothetical protein